MCFVTKPRTLIYFKIKVFTVNVGYRCVNDGFIVLIWEGILHHVCVLPNAIPDDRLIPTTYTS
jgi:hypothetical protein